jgi:hypothetical protein
VSSELAVGVWFAAIPFGVLANRRAPAEADACFS